MGQFLLAEGYGTAGHHQTLPSFILQLGHLASIRLMTNGSLPSQRILCCSVDMEPVPRWMPSGPGPIRTRPRGWWQPIRVWWRRAALSSTGSAAWRPPETTSLEHRPSDGVAGAAPQSPQHSETISKSNVCFYANSFAPWSDSMPIFLAICIVIPVMVYANFYPCPFFLGGGRRFFFMLIWTQFTAIFSFWLMWWYMESLNCSVDSAMLPLGLIFFSKIIFTKSCQA